MALERLHQKYFSPMYVPNVAGYSNIYQSKTNEFFIKFRLPGLAFKFCYMNTARSKTIGYYVRSICLKQESKLGFKNYVLDHTNIPFRNDGSPIDVPNVAGYSNIYQSNFIF
ncbi:unnamed protein product [Brachionus calyciflorus]|uniref:Uncharacterized protein n=1 Tax=Brachionus calyciflorus TaxID=104777 RepID=A0A814DZI4_9BILA|nr:unnamed protein product [Brachionus calyciflorus]